MKCGLAIVCVLVSLPAAVAAQSDSVPEGFLIRQTDAAKYFLSQAEQSLYWHQNEAGTGDFTCIEECLESWVPVKAQANTPNHGAWAAVQRPEGTWQWAYDAKPLYTFAGDTFPGARLGDGLGRGQWQLLVLPKPVPPGMSIQPNSLGYVLANHQGRTLYTQERSDQTTTAHWTPFKAPWLALDQGDWAVQSAPEGGRQWSYKGRLLFTYDKDSDPQDVQGHELDGGWSAVILESAPGLPSWMTIQAIDVGLAYANEDGLTLYAPVDIDAINAAQTCPEECMQLNWRAVMAGPDEESIGNWVIVENGDGQLQWSYKGQLLYTHTRDEKPGDMRGNGIAVGYRIGDGWRIIPVETGQRRSRT